MEPLWWQPVCFYKPTSQQVICTSTLQNSMQQCWISFEPAAHCGELDIHFFTKWLTEECVQFTCGNSQALNAVWYCVFPPFFQLELNESKSGTCFKELKGCVYYIFASLFLKSKQKHLSNKEKCFLIHFKSSLHSQENQILKL